MTRYLDLAEYLWLAEQVTGVEAAHGGSRRFERDQQVDAGTRIRMSAP